MSCVKELCDSFNEFWISWHHTPNLILQIENKTTSDPEKMSKILQIIYGDDYKHSDEVD